MRDQKNECSYVSLRDVERVLLVTTWFYGQTTNRLLFNEMDRKLSVANEYESVVVEDATADENQVVVEQPARLPRCFP
ncbi:hypothetical protein DPMN_042219 [Dreissena polymorpha]|uniref:Uncharacterized protein n=1 Tax=Dreissena polymorpha TaxID=45954 RepID=A0A9D4HWR4_DREPO|nr:hypothetical protein DPMN_042219 [Dreissena polymorpha]